MKTFLEYLNEVSPAPLPFRLRELLQLICLNCSTNEAVEPLGTYVLCDSFTQFLHKFDVEFSAISFNLGSPDLFENTVEYKTVDDVHKFVNQVVELIKLMLVYHNTLNSRVRNADVLAHHMKSVIACYNNLAITLNSFSSEFFGLVTNSKKLGNCKNMDIFGESLLKVFNGEMLIPIIKYNGTFAKYNPDIIEEI